MAERGRTRPVRVAVATDDDALDVQRFGHATRFAVYELVDGDARLIEMRDCVPACGAPGRHEERLGRAADVIGDCRAVIVREIGPGAAAAVTRRGLSVQLGYGTIAEALDALLARNRAPIARRLGGPA